jgi:enoyl-CoA hydratase/carnithine racemase
VRYESGIKHPETKELAMLRSPSGLFRFELGEGRAFVAFHDRPHFMGVRLEILSEMRNLFDELERRDLAVVHLAFPVHSLGDKLAVGPRQFRGAMLALIREENGFLDFIRGVRRLPSIVVCSMAGEVDFALLGLALACDLRITADDTLFVNQWLRGGEPPMGAAVWFLTHYLGVGRATSLLLDRPALTARTAKRLGLVQRCVPPAELLRVSEEAAGCFTRLPRGAVTAMKRALVAATGDLRSYLELEAQQIESEVRS